MSTILKQLHIHEEIATFEFSILKTRWPPGLEALQSACHHLCKCFTFSENSEPIKLGMHDP